jgi:hypothetical protein
MQIKSEAIIRDTLRTGDYGEIEETPNGLVYYVLDGSVRVEAAFDNNELSQMNIWFNVYSIPVTTISDALGQAQFILAPYLTPPEINALCVLIASEIPSHTTTETLNYRRGIGEYTLLVVGSMRTGDTEARVYKTP